MNKTLGAIISVLLVTGAAVAFLSRSSGNSAPMDQALTESEPTFSYTDEQFATSQAAAATIDSDLQQIDAELELVGEAEFDGTDLTDAELGF